MNRIRNKGEQVIPLPALRDLRAPDNRKDWPTHDNVRVKPLGPSRVEVEEIRVPAFLLVRS